MYGTPVIKDNFTDPKIFPGLTRSKTLFKPDSFDAYAGFQGFHSYPAPESSVLTRIRLDQETFQVLT